MKDKVKNKDTIVTIGVFSLGIILLIVSLSIAIYDYININNSVYITSKIISLAGTKDVANISYTVNDKEYTNEISLENGSSLSVGDSTMVRVSIKNPYKLIHSNTLISILSFILGLIMTLIMLKKMIELVKTNKNIKQLKLSGIYIIAAITEVFINTNGKMHKKVYPYKLRSKYLNPLDNNVYTFDSEDTFINLNDILAKYGTKGVVVYIDRIKPSNYYVDLNSLIPHVNLIDPVEFMKTKKEPTEENLSNTPSEKVDDKENTKTEVSSNSSEEGKK